MALRARNAASASSPANDSAPSTRARGPRPHGDRIAEARQDVDDRRADRAVAHDADRARRVLAFRQQRAASAPPRAAPRAAAARARIATPSARRTAPRAPLSLRIDRANDRHVAAGRASRADRRRQPRRATNCSAREARAIPAAQTEREAAPRSRRASRCRIGMDSFLGRSGAHSAATLVLDERRTC